jgi:hypothetical protein
VQRLRDLAEAEVARHLAEHAQLPERGVLHSGRAEVFVNKI